MSLTKTEDSEPPLRFVNSRDEITGDEYDGTQRVQMSCGHGVDPGSLTAWCRSLIDQDRDPQTCPVSCRPSQGHFKLHCPADVNGGRCGAEWSYPEVRRCALLDDAEQGEFERKLALTAARLYCDFKECPRCKSLVERKDLSHLRVLCTICSASQGKTYEFCWQCLRAWKGSGTPSDHCANQGCTDPNLQVLATCVTKDLPGSEIRGCPSTRACPTCGLLIEHKDKCKYVLCARCHVEFCFACLDAASTCKAAKGGAWYQWCAKPLAPRQTRIPVWSRKD
ncbi:probable E3 ubiquitin-protein ligase RNF144A-A isoform X1 [Choloepus didactylus]|uniref:probable E3 ubiquitin-protein ligase RNF144A-A isoform X1 n=2 Tax=Choloepus didactylus TaxID=27675 RepID=UPI00189CBEA1|nr:probable E3 ubiquitin-protein ligase RNF144A-A isoform X1 [Choloepus didactylus]XP_037706424.1 probable E3 ubiquitin-protein ligase RNF144A-A isoform X1 [Choloepus didactylus]XP_037706425.1 probable E3 ubiquitin-protein ligase RNF144A-A isoform X1 [Choloepus didactylus]XP_037706426.1 probable E3 ubiquitin-protein ligase RNF144A-A isoform X1 [Choloepus didactylus]